jgi:hypothetical protein
MERRAMANPKKTPEQIGADKLAAATQEAALTDDEKAKRIAERFVWKPGDITITNPDGTIVT